MRNDIRFDPSFSSLLQTSFRDITGRDLAGPHGHTVSANWLYNEAPFGLLAHNAEEEPLLIYGNRTAQTFFGYSWAELKDLPSRWTAPPAERAERQRFLASVERAGFISGYRGLRVAKDGQTFWIEDATIWQVRNREGVLYGQAALLPRIVKVE